MTASNHLIFVHGAGQHYAGYSDCWFKSFKDYLEHEKDYDHLEILWNAAGEDAVCSSDEFPGKWIKMIRSSDLNNEVDKYLKHRDHLIETFKNKILGFIENGEQIDIICHSLGTVYMYEALHRIGEESNLKKGSIRNLFTVGSILTWPKVLLNLIDEAKSKTKPELVETWVNIMDVGNVIQLRPADFAYIFSLFANVRDFYKEVTDCSESFMPSSQLPRCKFCPSDSVLPHEKPFACSHFYYFDHKNRRVNEEIFAKRLNGGTISAEVESDFE